MTREFIIQRYSNSHWPMLTGQRPYVVAGPNFDRWVSPGSLERYGKWTVSLKLLNAVSVAFPVGSVDSFDRLAVAEFLLREGVTQAYWVKSGRNCLPQDGRWTVAIDEVARETIGSFPGRRSGSFDLADSLSWGLGTLGRLEHLRALLAEDSLQLDPTAVPVDLA